MLTRRAKAYNSSSCSVV